MEPPRPIISTEDDGCVRIEVGNHLGWVSSMHLVPGKCAQLRRAIKGVAAQSLLDAAA